MLMPIPPWLTNALVPRLTLLLNHVLSTEPAAMARLQPHAGRRLQLDCAGPPGWPSLPSLVLVVTPAGLLESVDSGSAADLHMVLNASQPLPLLLSAAQGQRPRIDVSGDAALASDVSWLFDHLRWDIEDDLAPWLGPVVARELVRWGTLLAVGVREAAKRLSTLASQTGVGSGPAA